MVYELRNFELQPKIINNNYNEGTEVQTLGVIRIQL